MFIGTQIMYPHTFFLTVIRPVAIGSVEKMVSMSPEGFAGGGMGATMLERRPLQDLDQGYTDDVRRFKPDVGSGRSDGEATTDAEVLQFPDPSWAGGICGAGAAGSHNDDHGHHRNLHRGRDDEEGRERRGSSPGIPQDPPGCVPGFLR